MSRITVFGRLGCPHCAKAKTLLEQRNWPYSYIDIETFPARRKDMVALSKRRTVPQIFFGLEHMGGAAELVALDAAGELAKKYQRLVGGAAAIDTGQDPRLRAVTDAELAAAAGGAKRYRLLGEREGAKPWTVDGGKSFHGYGDLVALLEKRGLFSSAGSGWFHQWFWRRDRWDFSGTQLLAVLRNAVGEGAATKADRTGGDGCSPVEDDAPVEDAPVEDAAGRRVAQALLDHEVMYDEKQEERFSGVVVGSSSGGSSGSEIDCTPTFSESGRYRLHAHRLRRSYKAPLNGFRRFPCVVRKAKDLHGGPPAMIFHPAEEESSLREGLREEALSPSHDPSMGLLKACKSLLNDLISKHRHPETSLVSYAAIRRDADYRNNFLSAVAELQTLPSLAEENCSKKSAFVDPNVKTAFVINLYNMAVKHAFIELGVPSNDLSRLHFFDSACYEVGGCVYSLAELENGVLRANSRAPYHRSAFFKGEDPRIGAALLREKQCDVRTTSVRRLKLVDRVQHDMI